MAVLAVAGLNARLGELGVDIVVAHQGVHLAGELRDAVRGHEIGAVVDELLNLVAVAFQQSDGELEKLLLPNRLVERIEARIKERQAAGS